MKVNCSAARSSMASSCRSEPSTGSGRSAAGSSSFHWRWAREHHQIGAFTEFHIIGGEGGFHQLLLHHRMAADSNFNARLFVNLGEQSPPVRPQSASWMSASLGLIVAVQVLYVSSVDNGYSNCHLLGRAAWIVLVVLNSGVSFVVV